LHRRGERRSPYDGHPPDAPTIETIVLVSFYEVIMIHFQQPEKSQKKDFNRMNRIVSIKWKR